MKYFAKPFFLPILMPLLVACLSGVVLAGQDQDLSKSGLQRQKIYLREGVTYIQKDGTELQVIVTSTLDEIYPSQTCWGETFDIYVSGVTGNLDASCIDDSEISLSIALWEEDAGWIDPDDRVREIWLNFPTNGLTSGIPYEYLFEDVDLYNWCDEYDLTGEFYVEVHSGCLTAVLSSGVEDVHLLWYPAAPTLVDPANGIDSLPQPVELVWNTIVGAESYQVQVDDNSDFSSPEVDEELASTSYPVSGLEESKLFHWRVRGHDATCGGGWWSSWRSFSTGSSTPVTPVTWSQIPTKFKLSQNYPNPFNPDTRIEFALPKAAHVKLEIFNIAGQKIRTLVDEELTAGHKVVDWNGKNDGGMAVSSGIYVYRMDAGEFKDGRKMILLR